MNVLLTGSAGFVGSEVVRTAPADWTIWAVVRPGSGATPPEATAQATLVERDLRDPAFAQCLPERIDAVIHLAQSRHDRDFPEQALDVIDVNVGATARLLDYAHRSGASRVVLASTATVYRPSHEPLDEESPLECSTVYSASKRAAELLCQPYGPHLCTRVLRIFTPYGSGQRRRLISNLIDRVEQGAAVTVDGVDGLPLSPIHVSDVARTIHKAATAPGQCGVDTLNVGGRERLGIRQLAETIGAAIGRTPVLEMRGADDPPGWIADRSHLVASLGLEEPMPFAEGLGITLGVRM